jgi:hypothetical protein
MISSQEQPDIARSAHDFRVTSDNIDRILSDFIHTRLMEYRLSNAKRDAERRDHADVN